MTDELSSYGAGAYICEFAAGGPKNYGYRITTTNENEIIGEVNKVRGIRLSYQNKKTVSFDCLKRMIFAFCLQDRNPIVKSIIENRILRDHERNVFTMTCTKLYRIVYDKRAIFPNFCTLPYGF